VTEAGRPPRARDGRAVPLAGAADVRTRGKIFFFSFSVVSSFPSPCADVNAFRMGMTQRRRCHWGIKATWTAHREDEEGHLLCTVLNERLITAYSPHRRRTEEAEMGFRVRASSLLMPLALALPVALLASGKFLSRRVAAAPECLVWNSCSSSAFTAIAAD
jgi:hypothetical protein